MKMKTKVLAFVALAFGLLTMGVPLFAHHGDASYDTSKAVVLKGAVVTAYTWMNPHSLLKADYKDDKGVIQHWVMEIGSVPSMSLLGWSRTTVKPGDVITVYVWQVKNGLTVGRINKIVLADGTTLGDRDTTTPSRYGTDEK
jgi:Family of unknown function (DUF6152)